MDGTKKSFEKGLIKGFESPGLITSELFSLRAESILNGLDSDSARARLSGLLLGVELHGAQNYWTRNKVTLIGSEILTKNYQSALELVGGECKLFNIESATLAGLSSVYKDLHSD